MLSPDNFSSSHASNDTASDLVSAGWGGRHSVLAHWLLCQRGSLLVVALCSDSALTLRVAVQHLVYVIIAMVPAGPPLAIPVDRLRLVVNVSGVAAGGAIHVGEADEVLRGAFRAASAWGGTATPLMVGVADAGHQLHCKRAGPQHGTRWVEGRGHCTTSIFQALVLRCCTCSSLSQSRHPTP